MAIQIRARAVRNGVPVGPYQIVDGRDVIDMPAGTHPRAYTNSRKIIALDTQAPKVAPTSTLMPAVKGVNSSSRLSVADHMRAMAYRAKSSRVGCAKCQKARNKLADGVIKALNKVSPPKT